MGAKDDVGFGVRRGPLEHVSVGIDEVTKVEPTRTKRVVRSPEQFESGLVIIACQRPKRFYRYPGGEQGINLGRAGEVDVIGAANLSKGVAHIWIVDEHHMRLAMCGLHVLMQRNTVNARLVHQRRGEIGHVGNLGNFGQILDAVAQLVVSLPGVVQEDVVRFHLGQACEAFLALARGKSLVRNALSIQEFTHPPLTTKFQVTGEFARDRDHNGLEALIGEHPAVNGIQGIPRFKVEEQENNADWARRHHVVVLPAVFSMGLSTAPPKRRSRPMYCSMASHRSVRLNAGQSWLRNTISA